MLKIGKKLKMLRKESRLSAHDICLKLRAKNMNMSFTPSSIYKWEENKAEPDIYVLIELCKILKASIASLLDLDEIELHNLTEKEAKMLDYFRHDETFMKIAMLMIKYDKEKS